MERVLKLSGLSGRPSIPEFKFGKGFMAKDDGTEDVKKMAFVPHKIEQRVKLSMDPMVESSWKSTHHSALPKESILLVGKSTGMPSTISRGFVPQTTGVGQMKLEAPPQYSGKRQPRARVRLI